MREEGGKMREEGGRRKEERKGIRHLAFFLLVFSFSSFLSPPSSLLPHLSSLLPPLSSLLSPPSSFAADTAFSGNFIVPEAQSGFSQEQYEVKAVQKLQRGAENFLLSPLEVPQGVKAEIAGRRSEYLPVGMETVIVGAVRGFVNGAKRWGVGVYEIFTFVYPQEPILPEFQEWLY